jgi:hypothetical protein
MPDKKKPAKPVVVRPSRKEVLTKVFANHRTVIASGTKYGLKEFDLLREEVLAEL